MSFTKWGAGVDQGLGFRVTWGLRERSRLHKRLRWGFRVLFKVWGPGSGLGGVAGCEPSATILLRESLLASTGV